MGALDYLTTTALSMTVSGNTGVAPFTTLFITGFIERMDPDLLAMEGWTETILASWWSLAIFGVLTVLEFIGKCVPIIDEIIDSVEIFVVPVFSILGSLATFGLFNLASEGDDEDIDTRHRELSAGDNVLTGVKVILCAFGVALALLVHLFKMLIRLLGEGCLTCCITVIEYTWITISLFLAIFIKPLAIVIAIILLCSAAYGFMKRSKVWRRDEDDTPGAAPTAADTQEQAETGQVPASTPSNDTQSNKATVVQQEPTNSGVADGDVEVQIAQTNQTDEGDFPAYNPDDFERTQPEQQKDSDVDGDVDMRTPEGNSNDDGGGFPDYDPDDFERPPAVAPHDSVVVPTAPEEPKD